MSKLRVEMSAWKGLFVPKPVLKALAEDNFITPTPIQTLTLPSAIRDHLDIVGAAETGSGKTLAFGIPLIHHILEFKRTQGGDREDREQSKAERFRSTQPPGKQSTVKIIKSAKFNKNLRKNEAYAADSSDDEVYNSDDIANNGADESNSSDDANNSVGDENIKGDDSSYNSDDAKNNHVKTGSVNTGFEISSENITDLGLAYAADFGTPNGDESRSDDEVNLPPDMDQEEIDATNDGIGCVSVVHDAFDDGDGTQEKKDKSKVNHNQPLLALVLTPTRELAVQVKQHIDKVARYTDIQTCVVVGGMSAEKQRRLLKRKPDIIVATPGRLWELIQDGTPHLSNVEDLKYLVIDEADRMIEKGHFQELSQLLELLSVNEKKKNARQTFVFSATLTLVHNGPNRVLKTKKKKKIKVMTKENKLSGLMAEIGVKPKAKVVDLSRKEGTAHSLVESRITSSQEDKDLYLYYFLLKYPGRTLVFANSKDALRRLTSVLALLQCKPLLLHADMRQKQRLKNLDRFKADARGLLLATDVAARGLDIPNVEHVIHFQVPRTSENYVHRSGRTARASTEGLSIMLISAEDLPSYRKIIKTLNRDEELPMFPVEEDYIPNVKARVNLARQVDKLQHSIDKRKHTESWFEKAAKEADLEIDDDDIDDSESKAQELAQNRNLQSLKAHLERSIKSPIMMSNFSGKYPTSSGHFVTPYMRGKGPTVNATDTVKDSIEKISQQKRKHKSHGQKNKFAKRRKRIDKK